MFYWVVLITRIVDALSILIYTTVSTSKSTTPMSTPHGVVHRYDRDNCYLL